MPITKPPHGDDLRRIGAMAELLRVRAQDNPNMTVRINRGGFWKDETTWIETPNTNTAAIAPPLSGARYDVVCLRDNGLPIVVQGTASVNPDLPTIPEKYLPLAAIFIQAGTTALRNDVIYDIRPFLRAGTPVGNHQNLTNRNALEAAHTISAITGLQSALDEKTTLTEVNNLMVNKADIDGTTSTQFTLNKGYTGIAGPDAMLEVERGSEPNVGIRWNETAELWEFTNDGTNWQSFNAPDLSPGIIDYDNLNAPLQDLIDGKSDDGHSHNDLYYTEAEVDAALAGKSDIGHTHDAAEIISGTLGHDRLPTNIDPAKIADGTVSSLEFQRLTGVTAPIQAQLDGKADFSHEHDGADITSGTINVAHMPTGIDAANIADGTVNNAAYQTLANVTSDIQSQIDGKADTAHTHDASDVISGILSTDRIPAGIDAAKVSSGVVSNAEFDFLDGVTGSIQAQIDGKAEAVHTHDAGDVVSGTLAAARIPSGLDAAKIAPGTVDSATFGHLAGVTSSIQTQLNNKAALSHVHAGEDITTGTITEARLPNGISATRIGSGNISNTEFEHLDGVTSSIQTQLNNKAALAHTHDASDVISGVLNVARIPTGISAANIGAGSVDNTEFGYLNGVTSAIQTQLDGKAATVHTHVSTDVTDFDTAARTAAVQDSITDGVANIAPSQNAVFDSLALKQDALSDGLRLNVLGVAPAAPAAGTVILYVLNDGKLYIKDENDVATVVGTQV